MVRAHRMMFTVQPTTVPAVRQALIDEFAISQNVRFLPNGVSNDFFAQL